MGSEEMARKSEEIVRVSGDEKQKNFLSGRSSKACCVMRQDLRQLSFTV